MAWDDWAFGIPTAGGYNAAKWGYGKLDQAINPNTPGPGQGFMDTPNVQNALGVIQPAIAGAQGRQAPMIDPAFRNAQLQQMGQLQGIASGQQQGAGELGVQRQVANALAAQQAGARMARGTGNAGLAARQAARQSGALGISGAGLSQQAALQDQTAAQGLLGQLTAQGRQGDLGVGQLQLGQNQANDQYQLGLLSQQTGLSIAQLQAMAQEYAAKQGRPSTAGLLLSAGGQIGSAAAMSDERLKTEITDARNDVDEMLEGLRAKRYRYRDEKHGQGPRVGIMAQDLQRSRAGRDIVRELPEGKAMDVNAALSAALASAARLHERLRKVERKAS